MNINHKDLEKTKKVLENQLQILSEHTEKMDGSYTFKADAYCRLSAAMCQIADVLLNIQYALNSSKDL